MLPSAAKWKRQPEVWLVSKIISQIDKEKKVSLLKKTPLFSFKASVVFFLSVSSCLSQLGVSCQGHHVRRTLARGRGCHLEGGFAPLWKKTCLLCLAGAEQHRDLHVLGLCARASRRTCSCATYIVLEGEQTARR